jgi:hypothetical protein
MVSGAERPARPTKAPADPRPAPTVPEGPRAGDQNVKQTIGTCFAAQTVARLLDAGYVAVFNLCCEAMDLTAQLSMASVTGRGTRAIQ